jgi:hypothetical protein
MMRVSDLEPGGAAAVRQAFRSSVAPGGTLPGGVPRPEVLDAYETLALDWFLNEPSPSAVGTLRDGQGQIQGYALVCVAPETFASWRRAALVRYFGRITPLLAGRPSSETALFVLLHAVDHVVPWRRRRADIAELPSAYLSISAGAPRAATLRALAEFVDDKCRSAGFDRWAGEIDEPSVPVTSLETLATGAVSRTPSRTLGWLKGENLDRLGFVRVVPAPTDESPTGPLAWIGPLLDEPSHARPA